MEDPFVVLGSPERTPEAVQSAFRRLALSTHPDKVGGDPAPFARLLAARDRALERLGSEVANAQENPPVSFSFFGAAAEWTQRMAFEVLRAREARAVDVSIDVSLEDVYHGRVKRVVIGVLRCDAPRPFVRTRQALHVRLAELSGLPDDVFVFRGMGDDPPAAILLGAEAWRSLDDVSPVPPRSDVRVRVRVDEAGRRFRREGAVYRWDLHATARVTLLQHYEGGSIDLPHPSGEGVVTVEFSGAAEDVGSDGDEDRDDGARRTICLPGLGLPMPLPPGGHERTRKKERGDAYVFVDTKLPRLDLGRDDVRAALNLLTF